jgi:hypothetical protein
VTVAAAVLLVLLTASSLASAWLIRGAYERERQRAEEAEEQYRLARESVDEMVRVSEQELADRPGMESLRKKLLESALGYYQQFIAQRRNDPRALADLEETQTHVKKILDDLAVLQGAGQVFLLGDRTVLEDLRLTAEQKDKVGDMTHRNGEQMMAAFQDFQRLSPEDRRQRFLDLARTNDAEVNTILTPQQRQRLKQIALQQQGMRAFHDPDVVAALKLTADQKERIRAVEMDLQREFFPWPGGGPGSGGGFGGGPVGPPGSRPDPDQFWRVATEKLQAVLTAEQARRWKEMTGEPFKRPPFIRQTGPFAPPGHPAGLSERDRP